MQKPHNPASIDAFLKSLNVEVEQPPQQSPADKSLEVRVMFARSNGLYPVIVHLFSLGKGITEEDLEGKLLQGQWTFKAKSLLEFSEWYALKVFELAGETYHPLDGIQYHKDPPMPTEDYGRVSYRLATKMDDSDGAKLLQIVGNETALLHREAQKL